MVWQEDPQPSVHPDWDLLYAAGTPVTVIATQAGARVGTVHRHLEVRRRVDTSLAASRAAAPKGPSRIWLLHLEETRTFLATFGRYPTKDGTVDGEGKLYGFLCAQRHALVAQKISWAQMRELDCLGTTWPVSDQERALDAHWRERLDAVIVFLEEHGRLPNHRRSDADAGTEEHSLGLWLVTANDRANKGKLLEWRREALDADVPGWRRGRRGGQ